MTKFEPKDIRVVGLLGHGNTGKTSLVERMLNDAGVTDRVGSVQSGNTVTDYSDEEKSREHSISLALVHLDWQNARIHLVDNPGYADFQGEVIGSIRVLDSAIVVVSGVAGIELGTDNCWQLAEQNAVPRAIFVNMLDRENSDFHRVVGQLQEAYGDKCVPLALPVGKEADLKEVVYLTTSDDSKVPDEISEQFEGMREKILEAVAETDDALIEKYLEGEQLSSEEISTGLRQAIASRAIFPILCGSVEKGIGTREFLDFIVQCLPSPLDVDGEEVTDESGEETVVVKAAENEPFSAFVFKSITDPYIGQLSYFRVYSGRLKSDATVFNVAKRQRERMGQLSFMLGKEQKPVGEVVPGDIVAVAKLKNTSSGDTLCDESRKLKFPAIVYPEPMVRVAIFPKTRRDEDRISTALQRLAEEDPTFSAKRDPDTKEEIASGMGDLHLNIMLERLKAKFGVEATTKTPKVPYKEAVRSTVKVQGKYKKQSGGRGQYGDVWIEVSPMPRGEGFEFVDKIVGGAIPKNFISAVEKGIVEAMGKGIIAGYPVTDLKVVLYDGTHHSVDSSDLAFKIAGSMAIQKAVNDSDYCILEPVMKAEITAPEEFMGDITGGLNSKRGRILGMESRPNGRTILVEVPLAEMLNYSAELRSISGGRGSYKIAFSRYDEVPARLSEGVIAAAKREKEE